MKTYTILLINLVQNKSRHYEEMYVFRLSEASNLILIHVSKFHFSASFILLLASPSNSQTSFYLLAFDSV